MACSSGSSTCTIEILTDLTFIEEESGNWTLRDGDQVVGTASFEAIETSGVRWDLEFRRSWRGWWVEFTPNTGARQAMRYKPRAFGGGNVVTGDLYKYRLRPSRGRTWQVRGSDGDELATIGRDAQARGDFLIQLSASARSKSQFLA